MSESFLPLKWTEIARKVGTRTGKQCRERYSNHLKPCVRLEAWTPVEDSLLCHLYSRLGTRWSAIARMLPGRTDNSVKNRFHHIRRRLEKGHGMEYSEEAERVRAKLDLNDRGDDLSSMLVPVALESAQLEKPASCDYEFEFGPFLEPVEEYMCTQCGLEVPSRQTGRLVCEQTGWCQTCTRTPAAITGDLLRMHHSMRANKELTVG